MYGASCEQVSIVVIIMLLIPMYAILIGQMSVATAHKDVVRLDPVGRWYNAVSLRVWLFSSEYDRPRNLKLYSTLKRVE